MCCGVKSPVGVIPRVVHRLRHRATRAERVPQALGALRRCVGFGRQPGDRLEYAVAMRGTAACLLRQLGEARCPLRLLDQSAGSGDGRCLLLYRRELRRFTTLARPEARVLGVPTGRMETYMLRFRQACGARRAAVHARSLDRVVECPVGLWIASDNGGPTGIT